MLTSESGRFEGRVLGGPEMAAVYCRVPVAVTGNNLRLPQDLRNRTMLIDIGKRPDGYRYKHPDAKAHAREARCDLLWALFTMVRHWKANCNGEPYTERRMPGCIDFSEKIGGILAACGIRDFLLDTRKQIDMADGYVEQAMEMAELWHGRLGSAWHYAKDLGEAAVRAGYVNREDCEIETKRDALGNAERRPDGSVVEIYRGDQRLANKLRPKLERVRGKNLANGYRIEQDIVGGRPMWRVVKV
jgi:hypothetical protein